MNTNDKDMVEEITRIGRILQDDSNWARFDNWTKTAIMQYKAVELIERIADSLDSIKSVLEESL